MIKNIRKKSNKPASKKISFSEGLEIVKSIQKKVEALNKNKPTSSPSNEYSF